MRQKASGTQPSGCQIHTCFIPEVIADQSIQKLVVIIREESRNSAVYADEGSKRINDAARLRLNRNIDCAAALYRVALCIRKLPLPA